MNGGNAVGVPSVRFSVAGTSPPPPGLPPGSAAQETGCCCVVVTASLAVTVMKLWPTVPVSSIAPLASAAPLPSVAVHSVASVHVKATATGWPFVYVFPLSGLVIVIVGAASALLGTRAAPTTTATATFHGLLMNTL